MDPPASMSDDDKKSDKAADKDKAAKPAKPPRKSYGGRT